MSFANEKLTLDQEKEFEEKGIKNPNLQRADVILRVLHWTIDYENDMCLVGAGEYREFPDETYFVFINKNKIIRFVAKKHFVSENILEWKIFRILDEVQVTEKDIVNITSALTVFKASGRPRITNTQVSVTFTI